MCPGWTCQRVKLHHFSGSVKPVREVIWSGPDKYAVYSDGSFATEGTGKPNDGNVILLQQDEQVDIMTMQQS
jgi:hypothetical protein